ncbi:sensor histidine kinase [Desulfosporosinus sp. PR]|uniref:sensor histidine kinase n=1 Tax=Candidatus Desulfosporosinus nitrosoreducens TaxID=3401928 RepID=UPI0027EB3327|nr:sensor histidine kinase [Desulfosporosinus sp. PR]MDQ7094651.1 sensor histidine kinase [Desulfosporosinus sp. PR]
MMKIKNFTKAHKFAAIRAFVAFWIFYGIFRMNRGNAQITALLFLSGLLLFSTAFLGSKKDIGKLRVFHLILMVLSLTAAAVIKLTAKGVGTDIYLIFIITEVLTLKDRMMKPFLILYALLYLAVTVLYTILEHGSISAMLSNIIFYSALIFILFLMRNRRLEREEIRKLNVDLQASNTKLREYSMKVEELTIERERAKMAQELHDSLGHSLMALTMHLDFAQKAFATKPEKVKEILAKADEIAKTAIQELRSAVSVLKEERNINDLSESVRELADNFKMLGNIKINVDQDQELEALNPELKNCIYKTIREGLTNGIRHGGATDFQIAVKAENDNVTITVQDNGRGSAAIIESNGLRGIRARIEALGGTVHFISAPEPGFAIQTMIPLSGRETEID